MPCTICKHPQRQDIDQALLNRTATLDQLSSRHGLSTSALSRHKQHLLAKTAQAQARFQEILREGYLCMLSEFLQMLSGVIQTARAEDNTRLLLRAIHQATGIIKFMVKLDSSLSPDTVHRLLASPQAIAAHSLLPANPQFLAEARQAAAHRLFSPCPEPGSEDEVLAELAGLDSAPLQTLLAGLLGTAGSGGCPPPPARWEKSGKKAGKAALRKGYSKEFQSDNKFDKSSGPGPRPQAGWAPKPEAGRFSFTQNSGLKTQNWIEDLDAGRLSVDLLNAIGAGRHPDPNLFRDARAA